MVFAFAGEDLFRETGKARAWERAVGRARHWLIPHRGTVAPSSARTDPAETLS